MDMNYIDAARQGDQILVWCRDRQGELFRELYDLSDYLYAFVPDNTGSPDAADLYGNPLKRIGFSDPKQMKEWCGRAQNLCESDLSPVYKLFLDEFADAPADTPYNALYYDIEVDFDLTSGLNYPTPENPHGEINLFQAFDTSRQCYVIFAMSHLRGTVEIVDRDGKYPVEMHWCRSERHLLESVAEYIDHVDVMAAHYGDGFDIPYIMARSIMLFGERRAMTMYCRDGCNAIRRQYVNENGEEKIGWKLVGRHNLDTLELYKKFKPGERVSFSLNALCEEDLGETKDDYEGNLGELYRENPQKFVEYGYQDVRLLKMLDEKHQIIQLAVILSRMNCVKIGDVTGSVKPIESGLMRFCHKRGIRLPDKKAADKEKFPGAIVYDTISGRYAWSLSVDLTGLYPSTMMMLGLSPETMIMQCLGGPEDYIKVMGRKAELVSVHVLETDEIIEVLGYQLHDIIRENGYTFSGNSTVFTGEMGILSVYVEYLVSERQRFKDLKAASTTKEEKEMNDLYQKVMKILANSVYGCSGEASFRLYDLRLSKSITLTARLISKWQAYQVDTLIDSIAGNINGGKC